MWRPRRGRRCRREGRVAQQAAEAGETGVAAAGARFRPRALLFEHPLHLRGERGLAETIELVKIRTRQFAKRQLTWFRRHGNCEWIELKSDETVGETLAKITVPAAPSGATSL